MRFLVLNNDRRLANFDFEGLFRRFDAKADVKILKKYTSDLVTKDVSPGTFDTVIATCEADIFPASVLREKLNLQGQKPSEAILFRNKVKMKEHAALKGLEIPGFAKVSTSADVAAFIKKHGYPVIVKPIDSVGSLGLRKIKSDADMIGLDKDLSNTDYGGFMVETWVDGDLYHLDGYVIDGAEPVIWPSRYSAGCYDFAVEQKPFLDTMMMEFPKSHREYALSLLNAYECRNSTFHIEYFVEKNTNRLVLCEIAARTGGDLVAEMWRKTFGLALDEFAYYLQAGLALDQMKDHARKFNTVVSVARPKKIYGCATFARQNGVLVRAPNKTDIPGVTITESLKPHLVYQSWSGMASYSLMALIEADSDAQMQERYDALARWVNKNYIWKKKSYYSMLVRAVRKLKRMFT